MIFNEGAAQSSSVNRAERDAVLALSMAPHVGQGRIRDLVSEFGSALNVLSASKGSLLRVPGIGELAASGIIRLNPEFLIREQVTRASAVDAELVTIWDEGFPSLLNEIYDPPVTFWKRGSVERVDENAVAIVGTRRATEYGLRVAYELASELAQSGYTIVSGLAYGIDSAAHKGALDAGGRTIAVLGSGVDQIYPARHTGLAERIIESGAVISECPMGAHPDPRNFPKRNRIISGLSLGTIVVEAFEKGGALLTAHLALEQNREVFAVPGPVHSRASQGCNRLIARSGAKLVTEAEDILVELTGSEEKSGRGAPANDAIDLESLDPVSRKLYASIGQHSVHLDHICAETELDVSTALVYLLELEFAGLVRQAAGKHFYRV